MPDKSDKSDNNPNFINSSSERLRITNKKIQSLLDKNEFTFKNMSDIDQDMGILLDHNSTIRYFNCDNMTITIESKINRIHLIRCRNMNIKLNGLISGVEMKGCHDITITNGLKKIVNFIKAENCTNITIVLSKQIHKTVVYEIDRCINIKITDHHNLSLLAK